MWSSFLENTPDHEWSMSKVVPCYCLRILDNCLCRIDFPNFLSSDEYLYFKSFLFRRIVYLLVTYSFLFFKIVSTLVGNQQNTEKMLLYAENHNQVSCYLLVPLVNFLLLLATLLILSLSCMSNLTIDSFTVLKLSC
mgnify:FL=1